MTSKRRPKTTNGSEPAGSSDAQTWAQNQQQTAADCAADRRSQKLKEEIEQLKSFIPASRAPIQAPLASLDFSIGAEPASLASETGKLAFGGAEHDHDHDKRAPDNSSSSSVDTPTLSGYLDCDELSDMVDDSLFEITAAGCLSKSVFPRQPPAESRQRPRKPPEDGERTPTNEAQEEAAAAEMAPTPRQFACASSRAATTAAPLANPAQMSSIMAHVQSLDYSSTSSVPRQIRGSLSIASGYHNGARAAATTTPLLANGARTPDASRTSQLQQQHQRQKQKLISKVAGQTRAPSDGSSAAAVSGRNKHLSSSSSSGALLRAGRLSEQVESSEELDELEVEKEEAKKKKKKEEEGAAESQREGRGKSAAGHTRQQTRCPACAASRQESVSKRKTMSNFERANRKKKSFASSLLSLFTGGGSGASVRAQTDKPAPRSQLQMCQLHNKNEIAQVGANSTSATKRGAQLATSGEPNKTIGSNQACRASQETPQQPSPPSPPPPHRQHKIRSVANQRATKGPRAQRDYPLPALRLRDSIKITNQRKLRSSAARDNKQIGPNEGEVLLNLSNAAAQAEGAPGKSNNAQSSVNAAPKATTTTGARQSSDCSMISGGSLGSLRQRAGSSSAPKSKCVKFTTPDRVLILSPEPAGLGAGPQRQPIVASRPVQSSSSYSSLAGPLQPAPIIKRPAVPKSSSYSQTDANSGLEELLARYEQNNRLVAEINEKLRLTETIASNLSALDGGGGGSGGGSGDQLCRLEAEKRNCGDEDDETSSLSASQPDGSEPMDEDELLQRQLEVIEASRVFSWRPEDELAQARLTPAPTLSNNGNQMEPTPEEQQLEREAASRCECNNLVTSASSQRATNGQIGARNQIESDDQISGQPNGAPTNIHKRPPGKPNEEQDKISAPQQGPGTKQQRRPSRGESASNSQRSSASSASSVGAGALLVSRETGRKGAPPRIGPSSGALQEAGSAPEWPPGSKQTEALF